MSQPGKRAALIAKYADELRNTCGVEPDMALLEKVTIGLGPALYGADSTYVSSSDAAEVETVRKNFLIKKLGLADGPALNAGLGKVFDTYGQANRQKHRAVVYYLLVKHFGRESVYS